MLIEFACPVNAAVAAQEEVAVPHFVVEYSSNLEDRLDLDGLIRTVHETAAGTGVFERKGIRTRAARRDRYRIADGHPENGFVNLVARIAQGRSVEVRKEAGEKIFSAVCEHLAPIYETSPLAISFEIQEINPVAFRQNNLPDWLAQREEAQNERS